MRPIDELRRQMTPFRVRADFSPSGDRPAVISELKHRIRSGEKDVVLLGATGTGKTAAVAQLTEWLQRPVLMMQPNKTFAAQFANELRQFFPDNAVEYFVSYYDYYQPEVYAPQTDIYIEKDSSLNEGMERLRYSVTSSLLTRRDCIVVATVSTIYGLGTPQEYLDQHLTLRVDERYERSTLLRRLVDIQYDRNDLSSKRGNFRVRGDVLETFPIYEKNAVRVEFFDDEVEHISTLVPLTGEALREEDEIYVFPATHYSTGPERMERAVTRIEAELTIRLQDLEAQNKLLEVQRLRMHTSCDIGMMRQIGTCPRIENYSRHIDGHATGSAPTCPLDYFPEDLLLVVDKSHVTIPQIGGMYESGASRKRTLVKRGFRLPGTLNNRPLKFDEFCRRIRQTVCLSATPGPYEPERGDGFVKRIIRSTGLVDPEIVLKPTGDQIDDLVEEIRTRTEHNERVLVTTLTKKMAENLTDYLMAAGTRARYLHSDTGTFKRVELLRELRLGDYDVLVGINLLREGLDLPEVSLVAILDAGKEGFLRSRRPLIQAVGRATRNVTGQVHMYADTITPSMAVAIDETSRQRTRQLAYNTEHGIDPQPLRKRIADITGMLNREDADAESLLSGCQEQGLKAGELPERELAKLIDDLTAQMHQTAADLQFELAARHRDEIINLKKKLRQIVETNK